MLKNALLKILELVLSLFGFLRTQDLHYRSPRVHKTIKDGVQRVSVQYLKKVVKEDKKSLISKEQARKELARRGELEIQIVNVTLHSINRASFCLLDQYISENSKMGFATWLIQKSQCAYRDGIDVKNLKNTKSFESITYVFSDDYRGNIRDLITVYPT